MYVRSQSATVNMGNVLSEGELQELKSHVKGINPEGLAKVIHHAINDEGKTIPGEFGIQFMEPTNEEVGAGLGMASVVLWQDNFAPQQMTKKNFLKLLKFVGEETLANYDVDAAGVIRLEAAMENLKKVLATENRALLTIDTTEDHRNDSGYNEEFKEGLGEAWTSLEMETESVPTLVDEPDDVFVGNSRTSLPTSPKTSHGTSPKTSPKTSPQASVRSTPSPSASPRASRKDLRMLYHEMMPQKGIAAVIERLPELRTRMHQETNKLAVDRARTRLRTLNAFSVLRQQSTTRQSPGPDELEGRRKRLSTT